jgi:aerobic carbon-monoxide dehydrogenase small subunit
MGQERSLKESMKKKVTLRINGETHELFVEARRTLLEVLREDLSLTGTKEVCDMGSCGACTVLISGRAVLSCLVLAASCNHKEIQTIEGLRQGEELHPLQDAFVREGAIQCGMCTPGLIMTAKSFLDENPHPHAREIKEAISGNLCRCTGYEKVVEAVMSASMGGERQKIQKEEEGDSKKGRWLAPETGE